MRFPSTLTCRFRMLNSVPIASPHMALVERKIRALSTLLLDLKLTPRMPIELRLIEGDRGPEGQLHRLNFHPTDFAMLPCQTVIRAVVFGEHKGIGRFI